MKDVSATLNNRIGNVGSVEPTRPSANRSNGVDANVFKDQLRALQHSMPQAQTQGTGGAAKPNIGASALKFSNHAVDRMMSRGISFSPDQMGRIESAVQKAASKGAKDTLLLTDEAALIVSVKDKTVVTVMDKAALKENVFTNIDSTVMV